MKKLTYLLLLFCMPTISLGQDRNRTKELIRTEEHLSKDFSREILDSSWNKIRNSSYGTIIGAAGNTNSIGNFGSLDPLNGSVTFKGVLPIGNPGKKLSFLSLQGTADLISDSYAALFKNTKLNTNASIQLEYNFRIGASKSRTLQHDEANYLNQKGILEAKKQRAIDEYTFQINLAKQKKEVVDLNITVNEAQLADKNKAMKQQVTTLHNAIASLQSAQALNTIQEQINTLKTDISKLEKETRPLIAQSDSLSLLIRYSSHLIDYNDIKAKNAYHEEKNKLQKTFQFTGQSFWWITLTAGAGRKDYYTYDKSLAFEKQIGNDYTKTFKLGAAINFFKQSNLERKAFLFNAGFQRLRDNNLSTLTTMELNQEVAYKNGIGDTTRKLSKKYTVYTDGVEELRQWNGYTNLYYILAGGSSAIHFFPSYYKTDHKTGYIDLGLGYIASFKSTISGSPNFNLEGYVILNDTFDSVNTKGKIWDRNTIGVRATFPFDHLFNP